MAAARRAARAQCRRGSRPRGAEQRKAGHRLPPPLGQARSRWFWPFARRRSRRAAAANAPERPSDSVRRAAPVLGGARWSGDAGGSQGRPHGRRPQPHHAFAPCAGRPMAVAPRRRARRRARGRARGRARWRARWRARKRARWRLRARRRMRRW
eukprot:6535040-Prymnesium_polylepis.1